MTPMPDEPGWYIGTPDGRGEFLVVDTAYWQRRTADFFPDQGKNGGRWYVQGRPYCDPDGIACWRPLPRTPKRPEPKTRDDSRTIVKD